MSNAGGSRSRSRSADEPTAKRARKLTAADLGAPIEDEETARQKLADAGFDPDNLTMQVENVSPPDGEGSWDATPMTQFCGADDLKMVRYLVSKGVATVKADDDDDDDENCSPMRAALLMGQTAVCEWLFEHGAAAEVRYAASIKGGRNLLRNSLSAWRAGRGSNASQWLVRNGALTRPDGIPDENAIKAIASYEGATSDFRNLLVWAKESFKVNSNIHLILLGSLLPREYSTSTLKKYLSHGMKSERAAEFMVDCLSGEERLTLWEKLPPFHRLSPLQAFGGKPEILEIIADFAGFVRGKYLTCILKGMVHSLEKAMIRSRIQKEYDNPDSDADSDVSFIGFPG